MLAEDSQKLQEDGERGFVSLRAYDRGLKRPTVRAGECVVFHGRIAEPIIAVPSALGTVDGQWSESNAVMVTFCVQQLLHPLWQALSRSLFHWSKISYIVNKICRFIVV